MSIATPTPSPFDDDIDRVLLEIERRLYEQATPLPTPAPQPDDQLVDQAAAGEPGEPGEIEAAAGQIGRVDLVERVDDADADDDDDPADDVDDDDEVVDGELVPLGAAELVDDGQTRRVRQLRRQVAEAHQLARLQADETPLLVDTKRLRKRRIAAYEAARLHELAQDPVALAYRDAKVRRMTTAMVMVGVAVGLAVSSIGVQASVATALELEKFSPAWWAAFLYEPAMSMPLLGTVAAQAYSAMRGKVVDRKSPAGKKMFRVEALLLTLTLILNCAPAFAPGVEFSLLTVLVHSLGPVVAVASVWVLPALWSVLEVLPVPVAETGRTEGRTGLEYRANAGRRYSAAPPRQRVDIDALTDRARALIAEGKLSAGAGVHKFREALGCGTEVASKVKKALAQSGGAS